MSKFFWGNVFLGVSASNVLSPAMVETMVERPVISNWAGLSRKSKLTGTFWRDEFDALDGNRWWTANWTFEGGTNYEDAEGSVEIAIAPMLIQYGGMRSDGRNRKNV